MLKWLVLAVLLLFLYHIREVFPPFVVGGIIAYLLLPLVNYLKTKGIRVGLAIALIYVVGLGAMGVVIYNWGPMLVDQLTTMIDQRKEFVTNLVTQISTGFGLQIDVEQVSGEILHGVEANIGKPEEIFHIGGLISKSLLSILVCTVSSVYFIVDSGGVGRFLLRFVPEDKRKTVIDLSGQMNVMLSKYVRGQIFLIILMSCIAYVILTSLHIRYALLIAIMSGFLEIIPVLGPFCAITIATLVAIAQHGIGIVPALVILLYWLARLFEDYVIVPGVIGHAVELHPLAVIFAVIVGETMAGALGMLIAIPVAASIKLIVDFCYPPEEAAEQFRKEHRNLLNVLFGRKKHEKKLHEEHRREGLSEPRPSGREATDEHRLMIEAMAEQRFEDESKAALEEAAQDRAAQKRESQAKNADAADKISLKEPAPQPNAEP